MKTFKMLVPLSCFLLALSASPSRAAAQESPAVVALEAAALAAGNHGEFERAAWLYAQAATIRSFGDESTIENLRTASLLRYYMGDSTEALMLMSGAAGQAVASGLVLMAAESYVDGAWIAFEMGLTPTAREFVESATLLAGSPHLTESESMSILARMGEAEPTLQLSAR